MSSPTSSSSEAPHVFDQAVALAAEAGGPFTGATHPAYANMIGPFGGMTAAQALQAVLQHPQRLGDPVALTVNFASALADGPFKAVARPARTNRSTQHWTIELLQAGADGEDAVVLTATAVTAVRRDTWGVDDLPAPAVGRPADVPRQVVPPAAVEWVRRYEMRPVAGAIPRTWDGGGDASLSQLWVRDDPPRPLDSASLTALADVFFPRIWLRRARLVPIGTVSMTVYYHADAAQLAAVGTGYLLGQTQAQAFRNGFFDQTAQLWDEAGALLATTHQVVYYKE